MSTSARQSTSNAAGRVTAEVKLRVEVGSVIPPGVVGPLPVVTARVGRADSPILAVEERTGRFRHNDAIYVVKDLTMGTVGAPALAAAVVYAVGMYADALELGVEPRTAYTVSFPAG